MNKHFIYTGSRSGSNYLVNLLNAHPQITNYGEVMGDWTVPYKLHTRIGLGGKSTIDYLNYIYTDPVFFYAAQLYSAGSRAWRGKPLNFKHWNQIKTIGIKDFHMHFRGEKNYLWSFFKSRDELLIINLYRKNLLNKLISLKMMSVTDVVRRDESSKTETREKPKSKAIKIKLNPDEVLEVLEQNEVNLQERMDNLNQIDSSRVFHLAYEDLFESASSQEYYRDEIFKFLGVDLVKAESSHRKVLTRKLPDLIENYEEIYKALIKTKFAKYLSEEELSEKTLKL